MSRRAVVIGAGIGGMAAARALASIGWDVQLVERRPGRETLGAGWSFAPNAVTAMTALGLGERVRAISSASEAGVTLFTSDGVQLMRFDPKRNVPLLANTRVDLYRLLEDALPQSVTRRGGNAAVTDAGDVNQPARVNIDDEEFQADLVVAADGIGSHTRQDLVVPGSEHVFQSLTCWRGLTPLASFPTERGFQSWSLGLRFGVHPVGGGRQYWFLLQRNAVRGSSDADERAAALSRVAGWHEPVPDLIRATAQADLFRLDIDDIDPLPRYSVGRVALIGDAAHAMTPLLGQGAAQTLEDVVTLASILRDDVHVPNVPAALSRYDAQRRPRSQRIQKRSRSNARITVTDSHIAYRAGLLAVRLMPRSIADKAAASVWNWQAPPVD